MFGTVVHGCDRHSGRQLPGDVFQAFFHSFSHNQFIDLFPGCNDYIDRIQSVDAVIRPWQLLSLLDGTYAGKVDDAITDLFDRNAVPVYLFAGSRFEKNACFFNVTLISIAGGQA